MLREVGRLLAQSKPSIVEGDGAPGQRFNTQLGSGAITSDHGKVFVVQITEVSKPIGRRARYEFVEVGINWEIVDESDDDVTPVVIDGGLVAKLPQNPAFSYLDREFVIGDYCLARRSRLSPYAFELTDFSKFAEGDEFNGFGGPPCGATHVNDADFIFTDFGDYGQLECSKYYGEYGWVYGIYVEFPETPPWCIFDPLNPLCTGQPCLVQSTTCCAGGTLPVDMLVTLNNGTGSFLSFADNPITKIIYYTPGDQGTQINSGWYLSVAAHDDTVRLVGRIQCCSIGEDEYGVPQGNFQFIGTVYSYRETEECPCGDVTAFCCGEENQVVITALECGPLFEVLRLTTPCGSFDINLVQDPGNCGAGWYCLGPESGVGASKCEYLDPAVPAEDWVILGGRYSSEAACENRGCGDVWWCVFGVFTDGAAAQYKCVQNVVGVDEEDIRGGPYSTEENCKSAGCAGSVSVWYCSPSAPGQGQAGQCYSYDGTNFVPGSTGPYATAQACDDASDCCNPYTDVIEDGGYYWVDGACVYVGGNSCPAEDALGPYGDWTCDGLSKVEL